MDEMISPLNQLEIGIRESCSVCMYVPQKWRGNDQRKLFQNAFRMLSFESQKKGK
jgi:hypothetical protein